ncbi:MAG: FAD-dependent oxidoreductase, partial [Candidatus Bathyarchaeia archaeon]
MSSEKPLYDVVIVGAGPGGYVAAIRAAQLGGKVAIVEREEVGGTCLNKGCIPTKVLLRVAELRNAISKADRLGLNVSNVTLDTSRVMAKKNEVVKTLTRGVRFLLSKNRVELFKGEAKVVAPLEVEVKRSDGAVSILRGRNIIIATGSRVAELPVERSQLALSTDGILEISSFPKDIVIIGGGASGVEFASIFKAFNANVAVIEILSNLLPLEDEDIGTYLRKTFTAQGIKVLTSSKVTRITESPGARRTVHVE